jgi:hypothetical protein
MKHKNLWGAFAIIILVLFIYLKLLSPILGDTSSQASTYCIMYIIVILLLSFSASALLIQYFKSLALIKHKVPGMALRMQTIQSDGGAGGNGGSTYLNKIPENAPRKPWWKKAWFIGAIAIAIAIALGFFLINKMREYPVKAAIAQSDSVKPVSVPQHTDTVATVPASLYQQEVQKKEDLVAQLAQTTAAKQKIDSALQQTMQQAKVAKRKSDSTLQKLQTQLAEAEKNETLELAKQKQQFDKQLVAVQDSLQKRYRADSAKHATAYANALKAAGKNPETGLLGNGIGEGNLWEAVFKPILLKFGAPLLALLMVIWLWSFLRKDLKEQKLRPETKKKKRLLVFAILFIVAGMVREAYFGVQVINLAPIQKEQAVNNIKKWYEANPKIINNDVPYADPALAAKVTLLQQQNKTLFSQKQAVEDQLNAINATLQSAGKVATDTINVLRARLAASKPPVIDSGKIHEIFTLRLQKDKPEKAKEKQPEETKPKPEEKKDKKAKKNVPSKDKTEFGVPSDRTQ